MPVFQLVRQTHFPPPDLAEENGLLAVGGDLSPKRLLSAYRQGIFPWYAEGDPILWWFTSPRLVLFPDEFRIPRRLARYARNIPLKTTRDCAFAEVIRNCATVRTETGDQTWITPAMQAAYTELHRLGFAHSIECWYRDQLVGGLYGIALDRVFFGESMFSRISCGSQFALIELVEHLKSENFKLIDCQMTTNHLLRFGAREINGKEFQHLLKENIRETVPHENWKNCSKIGK